MVDAFAVVSSVLLQVLRRRFSLSMALKGMELFVTIEVDWIA